VELSHLEVLLAVADEKGFSRAAERLRRTQPAVSQAIRRLEEEIGRPVFDRSSKDATLTDAGAVLYGYARQLLNLRREARAALQELGDLRRGKVVVAANEYTVVHLLPIVSEYRRLHPDVKLEVKRSLASEIPTELLRRDVEVGLLTYRPAQPGLAAVQVARDGLALLVAPGHRLARRAAVSIRELGQESFLAHNVRSPYRERVLRTFERYQTALHIVLELPSLEAIKRLVERGLGVALMPRRVAEAEIARRDVVALAVREMRFERPIYVVYRDGADLSHAARAFLACAGATPGDPEQGTRARGRLRPRRRGPSGGGARP
jgi:DNA-binding transcriptional LysR family regulator